MPDQNVADVVQQAEAIAQADGRAQAVLPVLRQLPLVDFGRLMFSLPLAGFPALSGVLPAMAAEDVQRAWTGAAGEQLLGGSVDFVERVTGSFAQRLQRLVTGGRVLDFGCGYGRMMRLMYYFTDPGQVVGVDPWSTSLDLCRKDRLPSPLLGSDYLPLSLPGVGEPFDLIIAYSIFTHTSPLATMAALAALRGAVRTDGMLAITIRPPGFWRVVGRISEAERNYMTHLHAAIGFAFVADGDTGAHGDRSFGDTTLSLDWLARNAPGWRVEGSEGTADPWQTLVVLRPA